ncbi:Sodium/calcium exchanger protein-domain-containing protein [Tuber borchii]|uniref:Vacuolar calcium ion transporter n=1 Tax=Tuber borchii TaxID=42251 RepID=A0A2T7A7J8_TUBBO|nr:Sodium/calcium exchanger protein-domain-containing protein [Tuber borchii]
MHRLNRTASNVADTERFNPFCRLSQYRRRKAHTRLRNKYSSQQPRSPPKTEESIDSQATVVPKEPNRVEGPNRVDTIALEEGRQQPAEKEMEEHKTILGQFKTAMFNSWINVLLVFAPVGIATHYAGVDPTIVFVMNFIAIIPLAALLSYGTEEIALYCGDVLGGLLNASFGNAVELIVSILALVKGEIVIVQTSLIGSILSNLLLVLGMAFIAGGYNRIEQNFNTTVAQTASSLLALAVGSLVVPTAFHLASPTNKGITELSRGTAVILLLVYASYLLFQLKTHSAMYNEPSEKSPKRNHVEPAGKSLVNASASVSHAVAMGKPRPEEEDSVEEEKEEPALTLWAAIILLVASTALVAICSECLVDSIDDLVTTAGISRVFVGLILLPIVGNAAEHATAVTVAIKDKMDLSIGVAVGSSMQIALLVIPFIVVLGWIIGEDRMTLYFDGFQVMILFVSVLLVNYLIQDGKSNYLEGNLLVALYIIVALASYFYPEEGPLAQASE